MNVITKEYVYDLLETKLKVTDDEEIYLVKLIEELYDINNNISKGSLMILYFQIQFRKNIK